MTDMKAHAPGHSFHQLLLALLLGRGRRNARLRLALCMLSIFSYWILLVLLMDAPPGIGNEAPERGFLIALLAQLGRVFFSANVLRHLLPVLAGAWLAYRAVTRYLDDLYDIGAYGMSARVLRHAIFGGRYETLEISEDGWGKVPYDHPLVRIGGPGYLHVHLGFAALVETVEGEIEVLDSRQGQFIRGCDRLIDVIDLRDQSRSIGMIQSLTRDGIEVRSNDVQMVYRVYSGGQPRGRATPFPFDSGAFERLIHNRPVPSPGHHAWDYNVENSIRSEISRFVRDSSLQELLALSAVPQAGSSPSGDNVPQSFAFHIPRRQLTQRFLSPAVQHRMRKAGIELEWIRVGHWEIAGSSVDVRTTSSLLSIWQNMQQAGILRSEHTLDTLRSEHRNAYMKRMLSHWVDRGQELLDKGDTKGIDLLQTIGLNLAQLRREAISDPAYKQPPGMERVLKTLLEYNQDQRTTGAGEV